MLVELNARREEERTPIGSRMEQWPTNTVVLPLSVRVGEKSNGLNRHTASTSNPLGIDGIRAVQWAHLLSLLLFVLAMSQLFCSRAATFAAFPPQDQYPFPNDRLIPRKPFAASGKIVAMKGDVRYLARWAFVAREGQMRVQVFGMEGTFLADMSVREDSAFVLLPQDLEYHRGIADDLPLGSLLGLEIAWKQIMSTLDVLLWPSRGHGGWIAGTCCGRNGWFDERRNVFVHIDPKHQAPQYVRAGTGRDALVGEVESFVLVDTCHAPERLSFEWPGHDARMWIEITSHKTTTVGDQAFTVPHPPSVVTYDW